MKAEEHCKTEEIWKDEEEGSEHDPGDDDGNSEMFSRRPAPPGLGAAALWAREAASLKRKMGERDCFFCLLCNDIPTGGDGAYLVAFINAAVHVYYPYF